MPELPDVEVYRKRVDPDGLGRRITRADVRDAKLVKHGSAAALRRTLQGASLRATRRHGKWLFLESTRGPWLVLHFGMTGDLILGSGKDEEPRYTRLRLDLADGGWLAYVCRRRLGGVGTVKDVDAFVEDQELGPDAAGVSRKDFARLLEARTGQLKPALMDQSLVAGLGNVYVDEVLFDAGFDPRTPASALAPADRNRIYRSMTSTLRLAVDREADPSRFPRTRLLPHRRGGKTCPRCGGRLVKDRVGGRATHWCRKHQGRPD